MRPRIRDLDPVNDRASVMALFRASADYMALERGEEPGEHHVDEFFTDALPGRTLADMRKLGMAAPEEPTRLLAIADMGFGFPEETDAYLGLLQFRSDARGRGLGSEFLRTIERIAREGGASKLYLAVLHANPRGRAFWEREGFSVVIPERTVTLGQKTQAVARMVKDL